MMNYYVGDALSEARQEYENAAALAHYGVKGMKWGIINEDQTAAQRASNQLTQMNRVRNSKVLSKTSIATIQKSKSLTDAVNKLREAKAAKITETKNTKKTTTAAKKTTPKTTDEKAKAEKYEADVAAMVGQIETWYQANGNGEMPDHEWIESIVRMLTNGQNSTNPLAQWFSGDTSQEMPAETLDTIGQYFKLTHALFKKIGTNIGGNY